MYRLHKGLVTGAVKNIASEICRRNKKSNSGTALFDIQRESTIQCMILDGQVYLQEEVIAE